jgi:phospholipase C
MSGFTRREVLTVGAALATSNACGEGSDPAESRAQALGAAAVLKEIDTFVVLCMENRSYDHLLGARALEGLGGDGLQPGMKNRTRSGADLFVHPLQTFTPDDPPHTWSAVAAQINGGAMDGFVAAHSGAGQADVMGYHVRSQVPVTWSLADEFVSCDRWFCSVPGPTWPNRLYLHGATSHGNTWNLPAFGFTPIFQRLDPLGLTHRNYYSDVPWAAGGYFKVSGFAGIERYFLDAAAGTLPNFSVIDPHFFGAGANDDHPSHDVRLGQALIGSIYAALAKSPQWQRSLLVITYDEHGGFFDHVAPPSVSDSRAKFRQLGVRVPALVAGPYVPRGKVVSTLFEHTSVISTLTERFALDPLNDRARATAALSSCLDPSLLRSPRAAPPIAAAPPVSLRALVELDAQLARVRPGQHTELWDAVESGRVPAHLDRRKHSLQIAQGWLRAGAELGAVSLID